MTENRPDHRAGDLWDRFCRRASELFGSPRSHLPADLDLTIEQYAGEPVRPAVRLTIGRADFEAYIGVRSKSGSSRRLLDALWGEIDESLETDTDSGPPVRHIGLKHSVASRPVYFEDRW